MITKKQEQLLHELKNTMHTIETIGHYIEEAQEFRGRKKIAKVLKRSAVKMSILFDEFFREGI